MCILPPYSTAQAISLRGSGSAARASQRPACCGLGRRAVEDMLRGGQLGQADAARLGQALVLAFMVRAMAGLAQCAGSEGGAGGAEQEVAS